jgi:hypothetical protein
MMNRKAIRQRGVGMGAGICKLGVAFFGLGLKLAMAQGQAQAIDQAPVLGERITLTCQLMAAPNSQEKIHVLINSDLIMRREVVFFGTTKGPDVFMAPTKFRKMMELVQSRKELEATGYTQESVLKDGVVQKASYLNLRFNEVLEVYQGFLFANGNMYRLSCSVGETERFYADEKPAEKP